jgi:hypothetical protein
MLYVVVDVEVVVAEAVVVVTLIFNARFSLRQVIVRWDAGTGLILNIMLTMLLRMASILPLDHPIILMVTLLLLVMVFLHLLVPPLAIHLFKMFG